MAVTVLSTHPQSGVVIAVSVVVDGEVTAHDLNVTDRQTLLSETLQEVDDLKVEVADLKARLLAMEEQMTQLWFSPQMPGYEMAKADFTQQNLSCMQYARTDQVATTSSTHLIICHSALLYLPGPDQKFLEVIGTYETLKDAKRAVNAKAGLISDNDKQHLTIHKVNMEDCKVYDFYRKDLKDAIQASLKAEREKEGRESQEAESPP